MKKNKLHNPYPATGDPSMLPYRVQLRRELYSTAVRHAFNMGKATPAKRAKWLRLVKYRMRAMTGRDH